MCHPDGLALTVKETFFRITRYNAETIAEIRTSVFTTWKRAPILDYTRGDSPIHKV